MRSVSECDSEVNCVATGKFSGGSSTVGVQDVPDLPSGCRADCGAAVVSRFRRRSRFRWGEDLGWAV